jgi:hypothetical protein
MHPQSLSKDSPSSPTFFLQSTVVSSYILESTDYKLKLVNECLPFL